MSELYERRRISAVDGYALGASVWGERGPVVIINPATGVRQHYYGGLAQFLVSRGFTVLTWDYRGLGESKPHRLRGFEARMRDWGALDFEGVLQHVRLHFPGRAMCLLGHSVGGQVLGMAPSNGLLSGAITVASQSGWWGHWRGVSRAKMALIWFGLMPVIATACGYLPGSLGVGADLPRGVALEWARWGRSRDFFLSHGVAREGFERLTIPIHAWSFSDDDYAPQPAVDWLHSLYSRAQVQRTHIAPQALGAKRVGHFAPFLERFRPSLWEGWACALESMAVASPRSS